MGLGNVFLIPRRENPADGLTKLHSEILPRLRLMGSGTYNPAYLRPLKGATFRVLEKPTRPGETETLSLPPVTFPRETKTLS